MTEIRTRDEALAAVDRGLSQWAASTTGVLTQARAVAEGALELAHSEVRYLRNRVAAIEALMGSPPPADNHGQSQRHLARAAESLRSAQNAERRIMTVAHRLAALERAQSQYIAIEVSSARADLRKRAGSLASYRVSLAGGSAGVAIAASAAETTGWLDARGLSEVDVAAADLAGASVSTTFGRGGASLADYRWAVQTWDEVVRPGVARGMTRADFEARDAERGAPDLRRTAKVYDLFLGDSNRLLVTRLPDGSLDIRNGYHRFQVARDLGIRSLPAQVIDA